MAEPLRGRALRTLAAGLLALASASASGQALTGSFVGNGVDARAITGLGFSPAFVLITAANGQESVARTSTMVGDSAKPLGGADTGIAANLIESLDGNGFTVGNDARVNQSGTAYHWTALKAVPGAIAVGSFTGDGSDNRSLSGLGFSPLVVLTLVTSNARMGLRFATQPPDVTSGNGALEYADMSRAKRPMSQASGALPTSRLCA